MEATEVASFVQAHAACWLAWIIQSKTRKFRPKGTLQAWVLLKQIKRKRKRCWRRAKGHGRMSRKRKRQGRQREMHVFQVRGQPKIPQQAALQFTGSIIMPKPSLWPPKPPVSESQLKRQPKCKILAAQSHTRNRFGAEAPQLTFQFQRRARDDQRLERTRGEERSEGEF